MRYLVLGGGTSPEKDVSQRSAQAVYDALTANGYDATLIDPATLTHPELITVAKEYDGVFPILHGQGGEDGVLQSLFDTQAIAYFGPTPEACRNTFDKVIFKQLLEAHDLPTPRWAVVSVDTFSAEPLTRQPFVLKPINGGSSIDTFIIRNPQQDLSHLLPVIGRYGSMLIETLIEGTEITAGILGLSPLPIVEIIPPPDQEFDYENKYNGQTQELCPPEHLSRDLQDHIQSLALHVHTLTQCRDISRTDMMIGKDGTPYIIDTNTLPGLTSQSLYPKAAAEAGHDWPALVEKFRSFMQKTSD
jgi:D-alanine-D-alanine ligase